MRIPSGDEDRFGFRFDDEFGVQDQLSSGHVRALEKLG